MSLHSPNRQQELVETLKKTFLIGLGATVMTGDKLKESFRDLVEDLVAKGQLSALDAQRLAEEFKNRINSEKTILDQLVKSTLEGSLKKTITSLGVLTRDDLGKMFSAKAAPAASKPAAKPVAKANPAAKPAKKAVPAKKAAKPAPKKAKPAAKPAKKAAPAKKAVKPAAKKAKPVQKPAQKATLSKKAPAKKGGKKKA